MPRHRSRSGPRSGTAGRKSRWPTTGPACLSPSHPGSLSDSPGPRSYGTRQRASASACGSSGPSRRPTAATPGISQASTAARRSCCAFRWSVACRRAPGDRGGRMTAVLVVEDQQVLASALEIAIGAQPDLDCVGAAGTVDEALARMAAIRNPMPGKMVIEGTALSELLTERPAAVAAGTADTDLARFTGREREVLALMGEGLDPAAIAERLVVSVHTARGHVKNVMMKLGAHTQLEAVVLATRTGLLPPTPGSDTAHRRTYRPYRHQGPA